MLKRFVVDQPRAIAIVLGHLGATEPIMERYASWYTGRQCSVIAGTSPVSRFAVNASLRPTAEALWTELVPLVRQTPASVPILVHLFSNGGAFLWEDMEQILLQETAPSISTTPSSPELQAPDREPSNQRTRDFGFIAQRLQQGYLFFDSCPCYIRLAWNGEHFSQSFPHPHWSPWARRVYTLGASLSLTTWCTLTLSLHRPGRFWERMQQSTLCPHHVYAYTTTDLATDAFALEQLILHKRMQFTDTDDNGNKGNGSIQVYKYNDSNHCRLDVDHALEYQQAIGEALQAAIQRATSNHVSGTIGN